jgi:hypothetical protein
MEGADYRTRFSRIWQLLVQRVENSPPTDRIIYRDGRDCCLGAGFWFPFLGMPETVTTTFANTQITNGLRGD